MARRTDHVDDGYDSDDSRDFPRHHRRHSRRRSPSAHSYYSRPRRHSYPPAEESGHGSKAGTFVKLGLGIALVHVVATAFNTWVKNKTEENDRRYRREKRRAFEKAKAKRRRDEEKADRQRERDEQSDSEVEREIFVREGRRITYVPVDADPARDMDQTEVRGYLPAPDEPYPTNPCTSDDEDDDEWNRAPSRSQSVGGRSKSRFGRSQSTRRPDVRSQQNGRSRSRPAVEVT